MSWTPDRWAAEDLNVDTLAVAALEAPRCECGSNFRCGDECVICGREIRVAGSLAREFRCAAYERRLSWAAGMGLPRSTGFRGLSDELGPNPDLDVLHAALSARVAALPPDPWAEELEPLPALLAVAA